ncbi:MAG: CCXG family PEP-CTERM protein [Betaproteobacteria bacterium]|jgi:hypothetical protein|nr:CCXG family PEP-CTERM protein [Betaproteobacteria bacterium]HMV20350.1 CCXG family PEP-CTERM protein [Rhodocyclaceae bacterium]HMW77693.1 CCXG family PEP-CTERM protein [Rhodocyclaceae bacterium]HNE44383.1 CCXG family PEP-CTERM protein [Rhodocyclaceae bacterium]HNL21342.1 CCXG family PEP-CTERM protein [Rhodocyclaceae bacterium]
MKYLTTRIAVASALALSLGAAHASTISFQTRSSGALPQASATDYRDLIEPLTAASPTSGFCDSTPGAWAGLSNQGTCGSGVVQGIAFDISAQFGVTAPLAGIWSFRIGPDYGFGGALFIDGNAVDFNSDNLWWAGDFGNTGELLTASLFLSAGNHVIETYGLEDCCDGAQEAQFMAPGATFWTTFSTDDGLDRVRETPEPGSLLLASLGLLAMALGRRRS